MWSSSSSGSKKPAHQSASPFWRPPPARRSATTPAGRDPNLVVGASYSHADILKLDSSFVTQQILPSPLIFSPVYETRDRPPHIR
ncbi:TBC protein [Geosmithia morbida]|uniref:TBC protein n=1 Tax=Geosmithia morbida TaxID=1094350 RepID=A0A9P4YU33_9HYPO|nr:TBC protein [Geosmithia morbida]KAF4121049.1 TBC protein [Geosmithia morbida]